MKLRLTACPGGCGGEVSTHAPDRMVPIWLRCDRCHDRLPDPLTLVDPFIRAHPVDGGHW